MKVRYIGPYEAVEVPIPGSVTGAFVTVERGEWLDTSEPHASSLLEQTDNWSRSGVTKKSTERKRAKAKTEPTIEEVTEDALAAADPAITPESQED